MNRIIPTIGLLVVGFALTASSASAQYYGHYSHGHEQHQHHAQYNHGPHHGGHGYHNDYHGGYHATDYLTYPNHPPAYHPPAYMYAAPVYDEPAYVDSLGSDYDCPNSGYCPQAANGVGQQYAVVPSHTQQDDHAYGRSPGLNELSHDGHDHSGLANDGHEHGDHSHDGHSHGPVNPSLQNPAVTFGAPDRQRMTAPTLPNRNSVPQPPRFNAPSNHQAPSSIPPSNDGPIRMDGPPPSLTTLVSSSVKVG